MEIVNCMLRDKKLWPIKYTANVISVGKVLC